MGGGSWIRSDSTRGECTYSGAVTEHEVGGEERVLLEQLEAQVVVRVARRQARAQRHPLHPQLAAVRHVLPRQLLALTCRRCLRAH